MTKEQAIKQIFDGIYKGTEVLAELEKAGRIEVPEGESLEALRNHMAQDAGEIIEWAWVSFDESAPPAESSDPEG